MGPTGAYAERSRATRPQSPGAARASYGELYSFYRPDAVPGAHRATGLLCLEAEKEWGVRCGARSASAGSGVAAPREQRRRREEIRTEILVRQLKAFEEMDRLDRYLATMAAYPDGKRAARFGSSGACSK